MTPLDLITVAILVWPWQVTPNSWHILYNKLLQSTVGCGQAMAEYVILQAPEEGEISEEDEIDVFNNATTFEEGLFQVPVFPAETNLSPALSSVR